MPDTPDFYPPTPPGVPPDLTTPTRNYRLRVALVLTNLLAFALLYVGLVAGSAYFTYWAFGGRHADAAPASAAGLAAVRDVGRSEEQVIRAYNDALDKVQKRQMTEAQFARVLERDVLARWRAARLRL